MGRNREEIKQMRFLYHRDGYYHYRRRVPKEFELIDERSPLIRLSLKTTELRKAIVLRDIYELADNEFWANILIGIDYNEAKKKRDRYASHAKAMAYSYKPISNFVVYEPRLIDKDIGRGNG